MAKRSFVRKDRFYFKAKKEGYPARSAYKLIELDERFKIFKPGRMIIDLGCAPGGWLKVAQERMAGKGTLVGVDLLPLAMIPNEVTHFRQDDFTKLETQKWIRGLAPHGIDWVLSDMSPNISGVKFRDEYQSYELCRLAFNFACENLKRGGGFLFKIFPGPELEILRREVKVRFEKIVTVVPEATRQSSTEVYVVLNGFKGRLGGVTP